MPEHDSAFFKKALAILTLLQGSECYNPEEVGIVKSILGRIEEVQATAPGRSLVDAAQRLLHSHHEIEQSNTVKLDYFMKKDQLIAALKSILAEQSLH